MAQASSGLTGEERWLVIACPACSKSDKPAQWYHSRDRGKMKVHWNGYCRCSRCDKSHKFTEWRWNCGNSECKKVVTAESAGYAQITKAAHVAMQLMSNGSAPEDTSQLLWWVKLSGNVAKQLEDSTDTPGADVPAPPAPSESDYRRRSSGRKKPPQGKQKQKETHESTGDWEGESGALEWCLTCGGMMNVQQNFFERTCAKCEATIPRQTDLYACVHSQGVENRYVCFKCVHG